MRRITLLLFALMVIAQWLVPAKMIYDSERVLYDGVLYKFKTRPIDPSDPFRGKYVTLSFEAEQYQTDTTRLFSSGQSVYVSIYPDSAGYAQVSGIFTFPPDNYDYLAASIRNSSVYGGKQNLWIDFPFSRFYMEESKASEAEQQYWQAAADSTQIVYALVSVKNGQAVLRDVLINERSVVDIVREINERED